MASSPLWMGRRHIRSVIPPRPAVTTLIYLDQFGRPVRSKSQETPLSLVRTRDNKFWLQRVLENGEVIRWRALGLDHLKHATNFENYTLNDIDEYGGVIVPHDVMPTCAHDGPMFADVVYYMNHISPSEKITRKVRRQWHRRLYAHWLESPEKYFTKSIEYYVFPALLVMWVCIRLFHSVRNGKPFWDHDVYHSDRELATRVDPYVRLKQFSDQHPEHSGFDANSNIMISPAQSRLSSARAELRESDFTDPHYHSEFWWKVRHLRYYGHWPKSLTSGADADES
eukprot:CAMPEP_0176409544 /NCGR_PEP_ID=MMETSP0127-20121128/2557_1 /TAXON_ID=938130 /ORGANISM="Platyophrya macrostoma, Strain WH" /LENGTH=282 /DNA_ID=CAMNT_0017788935 /DNA_START=162 /DNA_END=1010 /DNA_ORIENTATION=-